MGDLLDYDLENLPRDFVKALSPAKLDSVMDAYKNKEAKASICLKFITAGYIGLALFVTALTMLLGALGLLIGSLVLMLLGGASLWQLYQIMK